MSGSSGHGTLMIDVVIFDLDGLLADTENLHFQSYQAVLAKYGIDLSYEYYEEHWIRTGRGIGDFIKHREVPASIDEIRNAKARIYRELVLNSAQPMPGALECLELLKGRKTLALATSSYADASDAVMTALNIRNYFKVVAANENVKKVKPAPDVFLYVARKLDVTSGSCLVLEDSEKGVLAANAAGMKCIAVPNRHTREHDLSKATLTVASLKNITLELIDSLARD